MHLRLTQNYYSRADKFRIYENECRLSCLVLSFIPNDGPLFTLFSQFFYENVKNNTKTL